MSGDTHLGADAATAALRSSLDQVATLVPYLRAQVGQVPTVEPQMVALENEADSGTWLSCRQLIDRPDWLAHVIRASGVVIGTDDPMVAASLFVQGYAYRILALAVACMTAGGLVPDSSADTMAIGLSRGRPARVAYLVPGGLRTPSVADAATTAGQAGSSDDALRFLIDRAVDMHLRPLVTAVRSQIRVGERLLWGNVAASASTAFRTMEGCLGRWVVALGTRFFELVPPEMRHQGSFLTIEAGPRHGWFWERTNCCLYDRLPGGIRCSDCSLTAPADRRAAYLASLTM